MAIIVMGQSESGDEYFFGVYDREPTWEEFVTIVEQNTPDEIFEGTCNVFPEYVEWMGLIDTVPKATITSQDIERP